MLNLQFKPLNGSFRLRALVSASVLKLVCWRHVWAGEVLPSGGVYQSLLTACFCALIGCLENILFYLIVCSPATQTRVSQSECRMVQNQTDDQLGGLQMVSHCSCNDTVKICARSCENCGWISWPCISVEYHHLQFLPAKQKPSSFFFFLSYINQSHLGYYFKSLKCPALIFIFLFLFFGSAISITYMELDLCCETAASARSAR